MRPALTARLRSMRGDGCVHGVGLTEEVEWVDRGTVLRPKLRGHRCAAYHACGPACEQSPGAHPARERRR